MKNAAIGLLAVAFVIVGLFAYRQTTTLREQVQEANAKLAARTASDALDLQAKCSKQAAESVKHLGLDKHELASYQSHYNTTMAKCFVQTADNTMAGPIMTQWRNVLDAFEGDVPVNVEIQRRLQ